VKTAYPVSGSYWQDVKDKEYRYLTKMEHIVNTLLHTCVYTQEIFLDCWCTTLLKIIEIVLASLFLHCLFPLSHSLETSL